MGFLFLWLIFAVIGALIGRSKGRVLAGFLWGLFLGPLGWLIVALAKGNRKQCPSCRSWVDGQASACPKCGRDISQPASRKCFGPDGKLLEGWTPSWEVTADGQEQPAPVPSPTGFCPNCGAPRHEGPYCARCGKPLSAGAGSGAA